MAVDRLTNRIGQGRDRADVGGDPRQTLVVQFQPVEKRGVKARLAGRLHVARVRLEDLPAHAAQGLGHGLEGGAHARRSGASREPAKLLLACAQTSPTVMSSSPCGKGTSGSGARLDRRSAAVLPEVPLVEKTSRWPCRGPAACRCRGHDAPVGGRHRPAVVDDSSSQRTGPVPRDRADEVDLQLQRRARAGGRRLHRAAHRRVEERGRQTAVNHPDRVVVGLVGRAWKTPGRGPGSPAPSRAASPSAEAAADRRASLRGPRDRTSPPRPPRSPSGPPR